MTSRAIFHLKIDRKKSCVRLVRRPHQLRKGAVHDRPDEVFPGDPLLPRHQQILGHDDGGAWGLNNEGGTHFFERNVLEERLHVFVGAKGGALKPHISLGKGIVRVEAELGSDIGVHVDPCLPDLQKVFYQLVAFFRRAESALLPPGPKAAAVHVPVYASCEGIISRVRELADQSCSVYSRLYSIPESDLK